MTVYILRRILVTLSIECREKEGKRVVELTQWQCCAVALVAGLALTLFVTTSSDHRYHQYDCQASLAYG